MFSVFPALLLLSLSAPANQPSPVDDLPRSGLDSGLIRKYYRDGDFARAIPILENALGPQASLTHTDSVFVFKHLGVMYAASESTRERGKYCMQQLLLIEPTARVMDMYADDMLGMIYRDIQEEHASSRAGLSRAEGPRPGDQAPLEGEDPEPSPAGNTGKVGARRQAYYWIGAVTTLAGVGVAAYFLTRDQPEPRVSHDLEIR